MPTLCLHYVDALGSIHEPWIRREFRIRIIVYFGNKYVYEKVCVCIKRKCVRVCRIILCTVFNKDQYTRVPTQCHWYLLRTKIITGHLHHTSYAKR